MKFIQDNIYHIYNQGNNRQQVFFSNKDYLSFLKLYRKEVSPYCETLCYCLMPNHFHFLTYANEKSVKEFKLGGLHLQKLSDGYRRLLSSYATDKNNELNRSGALFRPKTKAKEMEENTGRHFSTAEICFHYIHQNPYRAGLVSNPSNWDFSSLRDYEEVRKGTLCNRGLAFEIFGWGKAQFQPPKEKLVLDEQMRKKIYAPDKWKA